MTGTTLERARAVLARPRCRRLSVSVGRYGPAARRARPRCGTRCPRATT
jgi:hypothetical protein